MAALQRAAAWGRVPADAQRLARSARCQGLSVGAKRGADYHHGPGAIQRAGRGQSGDCRVPGLNPAPQRSGFMVSPTALHPARRRGSLMVELLVAMALLTAALLPLAYSIASERRLARASY